MDSHRHEGRVNDGPRRREQAGITAIGFLILAALFGIVGLAVMKLTPLYLQNMQMEKILKDVQSELDGRGATPGSIRTALSRRFDVEGITLPPDNVKINQVRNGYEVRIEYENRTPYIAGIWLLVPVDKQIEIRR